MAIRIAGDTVISDEEILTLHGNTGHFLDGNTTFGNNIILNNNEAGFTGIGIKNPSEDDFWMTIDNADLTFKKDDGTVFMKFETDHLAGGPSYVGTNFPTLSVFDEIAVFNGSQTKIKNGVFNDMKIMLDPANAWTGQFAGGGGTEAEDSDKFGPLIMVKNAYAAEYDAYASGAYQGDVSGVVLEFDKVSKNAQVVCWLTLQPRGWSSMLQTVSLGISFNNGSTWSAASQNLTGYSPGADNNHHGDSGLAGHSSIEWANSRKNVQTIDQSGQDPHSHAYATTATYMTTFRVSDCNTNIQTSGNNAHTMLLRVMPIEDSSSHAQETFDLQFMAMVINTGVDGSS